MYNRSSNEDTPPTRLEELARAINSLSSGSVRDRTVISVTLFYLFLVLFRPQDLPGLGWFGTIRGPIIFGLAVFAVWLANGSRRWVTPVKITLGIVIFEGLRGFVGFALDPNESIVVNDAWQFHVWRDIAVYLVSFMLPLSTCFLNARALSKLTAMIAICGGYLGLYAITHGGTGPGGSVGDENDLCFVLLLFLPLCGLMVAESSSFIKRIFFVAMLMMTFGGMVASNSRGGMLGLFAMLAYLFVRSKKKVGMVAGVLAMFIVSLPFIPQTYWDEMFSIKDDVSQTSGTVEERYESWKVAWAIFTDPFNILFGVGLQNTPWVFQEYETIARGSVADKKSLSGRAVHSTFFQLIADMGLYGLFAIGAMVWLSFKSTSKSANELYRRMGRLRAIRIEKESKDLDQARSAVAQHAKFASSLATAVCYAWVGGGVASLFISVLYYPQIWFMVGYSAGVAGYAYRVMDSVELWYDEAEATP